MYMYMYMNIVHMNIVFMYVYTMFQDSLNMHTISQTEL